MASSYATGFKELVRKYGRVAIGVHLTVSAACFTGCYAAVRSSVDVESALRRFGLVAPQHGTHTPEAIDPPSSSSLPSSTGASAQERSSQAAQGQAKDDAQLGRRGDAGTAHQSSLISQGDGAGPSPVGAPASQEPVAAGAVPGTGLSPANSKSGAKASSDGWGMSQLLQGGGAVAVALVCNKALFPLRLPLTFALTPPVHRFLVKHGFRV